MGANDYLSALNWGASSGGSAGAAETTSTVGADPLDTRQPPDQYHTSNLQIARLKNLLLSITQYYKGGTRLQVLAQTANPFGSTETGWYADGAATPNPRFSALGTLTYLANGAVTAKGDVCVFNGSKFVVLPVGSNTQVLTADSTQASGLKWGSAGGTGTVTSVGSGTGLSGGPITTTGTLTVDQTFAPTWTGQHIWQKNSIGSGTGTTTANILSWLQNTTASTSGAKVQDSPALAFEGHGWDAVGAADYTQRMVMQLRPKSRTLNTALPEFYFSIYDAYAGGSFNDKFKIAGSDFFGGISGSGVWNIGVPDVSNALITGLQFNGQVLEVINGTVSGTNYSNFDTAAYYPTTDATYAIGKSGQRFASGFFKDLTVNHEIAAGSAPTIAVGTAGQLGTGPSAAVTAGTDRHGTVTITTGTIPGAFVGGTAITAATVTFNVAYPASPKGVRLFPANANAAVAMSGATGVVFYADYASITTALFVIKAIDSGAGLLTASADYQLTYEVIQ